MSGGIREYQLVLADGEVFEGEGIGADPPGGVASGEVVFNTVLCGYQEVITDPSYAGQIITFTYPHIGNYGVNADDVELSNRAAFYLQRCADAGAAAAAEPEAPAAGGRFFSVQVAAVSSAAAADAIMQGLRVEGYSPEVVREGGLFKVRVGRFRQRAAAEELAREVRRRIGGEAFVVERS